VVFFFREGKQMSKFMSRIRSIRGRDGRRALMDTATLMVLGTLVTQASATSISGNMPWDNALSVIVTQLTGPVALAIAIGAFFVAGAILVFGEDMSAFVRRLLMVVIAVALLVGGSSFLTAMFPSMSAVI
jgi:type IV secretion system protein VirB2